MRFLRTCPIMRIFDQTKEREFYIGFLGMTPDNSRALVRALIEAFRSSHAGMVSANLDHQEYGVVDHRSDQTLWAPQQ
ncbi:glyoxalase superfamily protein [Acidiphilium sp. MT5]